jgi:hypothetical protein
MIESSVASNKAKLNRRLLDMGRRVRKSDEVELGDGEKIFNVKGSDIREVTEPREIQRFLIDAPPTVTLSVPSRPCLGVGTPQDGICRPGALLRPE